MAKRNDLHLYKEILKRMNYYQKSYSSVFPILFPFFHSQVIELKQLVEELCERDGKKHPVSFVSSISDASRRDWARHLLRTTKQKNKLWIKKNHVILTLG